MPKRLKPPRVKTHYTLTIAEWAIELGTHKNTITRWVRDGGLAAITDKKPFLVRGQDLKAFLEARQGRNKIATGPGEMACFACRKGRKPALGMLDYLPATSLSGRLVGLCEVCQTPMYRAIRKAEIARKFPHAALTITGCSTTLSQQAEHPANGALGSTCLPAQNTSAKPSPKPPSRTDRKGR